LSGGFAAKISQRRGEIANFGGNAGQRRSRPRQHSKITGCVEMSGTGQMACQSATKQGKM
jgi:hypothetical protein